MTRPNDDVANDARRRAHALLRLATAIACTIVASACPGPGPAPLDANHPPVARVIVPQLWPASEPVTVDGSFSDDGDGDVLSFSVDWGDGTPAAKDDDGIAQHTVESPGTYTIALTVEDADLVAATVQASIVLVGDDDSSCDCALGCFDDAVCTDRGCLVFRSSNAEDKVPDDAFDDALSCP